MQSSPRAPSSKRSIQSPQMHQAGPAAASPVSLFLPPTCFLAVGAKSFTSLAPMPTSHPPDADLSSPDMRHFPDMYLHLISGYKHSLLQEGYGLTNFSHPGYRPTLGSSPQDRGQIQGLEDSERDSRGSQGPLSSWLGHGQPHLGYTTQCQATAGTRRTSQGKRMGNYAENPHSSFNSDAIELGLKDQKEFNHIPPPPPRHDSKKNMHLENI